jgi:hypothetical protein
MRVEVPERRSRVEQTADAKTIRFGEGIDEAEAQMIVDELRAREAFG